MIAHRSLAAAALAVSAASAQTVTNLGVAEMPKSHEVVGSRAAFVVTEGGQGVDLDGDGRLNDQVLYAHDFLSGATKSTGLMTSSTMSRFVLTERLVLTTLREGFSGGDRNGDGDTSDVVAFSLDLANVTATSLGIALFTGGPPPQVSKDPLGIILRVSEGGQGAGSLNGDADAFDNITHAVRF